MEAAQQQPKGNGKGSPVLMPDRFTEGEARRRDWIADVEFGISPEQVMEPAYWAHVAKDMVAGDHIEVRSEDFSWVAFLIVRFAERTYAEVVLDRLVRMEPVMQPAASAKHKVEWKGPHRKFTVIRISDSAILQEGFKTRPEADAWMMNHEKAH